MPAVPSPAWEAARGAGPHGVALRVAIVANPQMQDVEALTSAFQKQNPDIKVNYVALPDNESPAKITASVSWRRRDALPNLRSAAARGSTMALAERM